MSGRAIFRGDTEFTGIASKFVEPFARGAGVYLLQSFIEVFHLVGGHARVFPHLRHGFFHRGEVRNGLLQHLVHAVDSLDAGLYVHHKPHPLVAPLGEAVAPRGALHGAHLSVHLRDSVFRFADSACEGVPLCRAALHAARVEFAIQFREVAFEFVGCRAVEVLQGAAHGGSAGFRVADLALYLLYFLSIDLKSSAVAFARGFLAFLLHRREPLVQLVKAFFRLLTVDDEFNGFDVGGGHKTSVLRLVGRAKVARLLGGGKDNLFWLYIFKFIH